MGYTRRTGQGHADTELRSQGVEVGLPLPVEGPFGHAIAVRSTRTHAK